MSTPREETIFAMTLELPEPSRAAFLDMACGENVGMRRRIEALVSAHGETQGAFRTDVALVTPTVVESVANLGAQDAVGEWIGRYRVLEVLGEGGCGVVYVAEQNVPVRRQVALKVIKLGMDTKQVVARFEAERQALAMMDHPGIAKVFDAGATDAGRPYFVMELLRGARITQYCDAAGLGVRARLELFIKVCQAIQHAHQKGIIHRDIKPSNILVVTQDGEAVPKVIDFGIAKATGARLTDSTVFTHLNQFMGTPAYMSPEQAEMGAIDIDTRSDIYSLGVVLYELLAGVTPFDPQELASVGFDGIRRTIREREPMRPSAMARARRAGTEAEPARGHGEQVVADLDWIVMKCLEKDRDRRYETANGLAMDLARFLNHEPVVARPPTPAYRMQKAWRRNRVAFVMASLVALVLVASSVVSTRAWVRAETERGVSEKSRRAEHFQRIRADRERVESQRLLYAANLNLVQQAWEENNLGRMRQLLSETAGSPDKGYEWDYWQRIVHQQLQTFTGHRASVWAVAFSKDASLVASGGEDHQVRLWDLGGSRGHRRWMNPGGTVYSVAFTPDGKQLLTADDAGTVGVWDVGTLQRRLTLKGHSGWVRSVAFSPDGKRLVSGGEDQVARVWNVGTGELEIVLKGHASRVRWAVFSPDNRFIATASGDESVRLWSAEGDRVSRVAVGHRSWVQSISFSSDSRRLATGGNDNSARLWDVATGQTVAVFLGHSGSVGAVHLSPDDRRLLTASLDGTARIWDVDSKKEVLQVRSHCGGISYAAFSPDGLTFATCGLDNRVRLWDASNGAQLREFPGSATQLHCVAFSMDGSRLAAAGEDGLIRMWNVRDARELGSFVGHVGLARRVAFSPDGTRLVSGGLDQIVRVWDVATAKQVMEVRGHRGSILAVGYSPDGRRIMSGSDEQTGRLWDAETGRELMVFKGHDGWVLSIGVSPDGAHVATGGFDQLLRIWDSATERELAGWERTEKIAAHRKCEEVYTEILAAKGPDHLETAAAKLDLAVVMREVGDVGSALRTAGEVLAGARAEKHADPKFVIRAMGEMSKTLAMDRQFQRAVDLEKERLGELRAHWSPNHPEVIHSLESIAQWNETLGKKNEAELAREELYQLRMR